MVTTPNEITSTVSMTATITTEAALTSTSFHKPTNHSLNTAFDNISAILISVIISIIGDIAVILIISLLIVCVVIRFKKGQSNTTVSESRSHTYVERPQATNPLPGRSIHVICIYYISIHVMLKLFSMRHKIMCM